MAIQNIGTTLSGIASDTKPTLTANEKGVIFIETDTNKIYQWDTDSWNQVVATVDDDAITLAKMASGTDGQIITYDASGNPTAVGRELMDKYLLVLVLVPLQRLRMPLVEAEEQ